jgi:general secretion pathway protein L
MSSSTTSLQLFGLDLRLLWQDFRASWLVLGQSRYLAWLTPALPVRVMRADGTQAWWRGTRIETPHGEDEAAEFEAVEVPEDLVLRKRVRMPPMPPTATAQAAQLEAQASSPFAADDLAWGYHAPAANSAGMRNVEIVLASRAQVARHVEERRARAAPVSSQSPEVWIFASEGGQPIVLGGWGEQRRQRKGARHRSVAYALIATALLLVVAMAITPSLQLRARSLEANAAFEGIQRETAAIVAQRDVFTRSGERLEALRSMLSERIDVLQLLTALTKELPDDTYLQSMQAQGLKVTLHGMTSDSAALMQTLGAIHGFKEVRAPQAATRAPGANAENFRIEIQLDPAVYALTANAAPAASAPAAAQPTAAPAAPAPAASPPTPPGSAPAPRKSRFSSGV